MAYKRPQMVKQDDGDTPPVSFPTPYHRLLYCIVDRAARDALAGREDAVQFFDTKWFAYMADHLDINYKRWASLICREVVSRHPYFRRYDWFRGMLEKYANY